MADTESRVIQLHNNEDYIRKYLYLCGTCIYRTLGKCCCEDALEFDDEVADDEGCSYWEPCNSKVNRLSEEAEEEYRQYED